MFYGQAHAHLESMEQELELLKQAPPGSLSASPSLGERGDLRIGKGKGRSDEQLWKIDLNVPDRNGPLLDQYGRVSTTMFSDPWMPLLNKWFSLCVPL